MNIYGYGINELETYLLNIGGKKFNAKQIYEWLYQKKNNEPLTYTNIKKEIREKVNEDLSFDLPEIIERQIDKDTEKYLFELSDKEHIEAVLMRHNYGLSVCISSEVGCNMGCKFCESGRLKKVRNLKTFEMVGQIVQIEKLIQERISSVVIMGIGEPLDNYDNVINFIKIINDANGLAIGARHITLSTCGLIPKINELSNLSLQINLAISLHAPNNKIRDLIMPINKVYKIEELMDTIKKYIQKTNRRVTIEYIMLKGINDSNELAEELANLLKGLNVYVNLIPYNETNNLDYEKSDNINSFFNVLKENKINVTVRREFGSNISAACGQLRSEKIPLEETSNL